MSLIIHYDGGFYGGNVEKILVRFLDRQKVQNVAYGWWLLNEEVSVNPSDQKASSNHPTFKCGSVYILSYLVLLLVLAELLLWLISGFMGFPVGIFWDLIMSVQILHMMPAMKLYLPTCSVNFFSHFGYVNAHVPEFKSFGFSNTVDPIEM